MKTVLVTGSEGNIGRYLVVALQLRYPDWKVLRIKSGKGRPFFDASNSCYTGDLRERELLELIFSENKVDYVIHAASASYSHSGYRAHPFTVLHNDCMVTLNVLKYAMEIQKLVFLSSALVYEHASSGLLSEDLTRSLPAPTSSYGIAKCLGEQALLNAQAQHGLRYTIWRPFNIVSPLEPTEGEGRHVFVDFFRRLFVERVSEFKVFGSGRQVRCFIWVEEAVDCIVSSLGNPATDNQTINLARDEPISLLQLKEMLVTIGREIGALPDDYDPPVRTAGAFDGVEMETRIPSTLKLKQLLQWESAISVRACFDKFVEAKLNKLRS